MYEINFCPTLCLPKNIFDKVRFVDLFDIDYVQVSQDKIESAHNKPSHSLQFTTRNCKINELKSVVEGRDLWQFRLEATTIMNTKPLNFGIDWLVIDGCTFHNVEGQLFEDVKIKPDGVLEIKNNVFESQNLPWKFHDSFSTFLQENSERIQFSNNTLNTQCNAIPIDLKEFITESRNSLEETVNGRFLKSFKCKEKAGQLVDLWNYEFTMDESTSLTLSASDENSEEVIWTVCPRFDPSKFCQRVTNCFYKSCTGIECAHDCEKTSNVRTFFFNFKSSKLNMFSLIILGPNSCFVEIP